MPLLRLLPLPHQTWKESNPYTHKKPKPNSQKTINLQAAAAKDS
jgi:hypothetical protein